MIGLSPDLRVANQSVSRETIGRIDALVTMLIKWNAAINLISKSSVSDIWVRHIFDSVQVFDYGKDADKWVDLGSGGGFPGLVVAILAAQVRPALQITLVESDQRKAAFLRQAAQSLCLSVGVIAERIEAIDGLHADVVSARALAPLSQLCSFADRHLAPTGRGIFLKGKAAPDEIASARKEWNFMLETHPSTTDPLAVVLVVAGLTHV
jgi:16S rRNA (guanine527-N7)-methyltransferase